MLTFAAIIQWITLGEKVFHAGKPAFDAIKAALAAHGVEADTEQLDKVIEDAARREAIAKAEAEG